VGTGTVAVTQAVVATVAPSGASMTGAVDYAIWLSVAAVLIALFAAFVGYITYRSQSDPEIVVFAELDQDRPTILLLVIQNIGNAVARDVTFRWEGDLPARAFGIEVDTAPEADVMRSGPLVTGIPLLPPGGRRVLTWGQYGGLRKALGDDAIWVTAQYRSQHFGKPWPTAHATRCPLEIASFEMTDASDRNYVKQLAANVDKLTKSVDKVAKAVSGTG